VTTEYQALARNENQALGLGKYALAMIAPGNPGPSEAVLRLTERFLLDSVACGVSALALGTAAPTILRAEALEYLAGAKGQGACCFGSTVAVKPEKAALANASAVREWDANGTNFGYNPARGATRGEFGHNDYYPVVLAGAQAAGHNGATALRGMVCLDEIRGRLAEVFALKDHKIDHVLHGAIASAAVYGALLGATPEQIESASGLIVAHYVPFRAIRHGHQLSDSKGASAAFSAEVAMVSVHRALRGFQGPADIFRNPQAVFCLFEPPEEKDTSPFDLSLALAGDDFAVMGMHFKLGLYEHQSAGAIDGLISLLSEHPQLIQESSQLQRVEITIYEPALSIIGDPAKRDPQTRQSADHSMVYIIATLLRKAFEQRRAGWKELMLMPEDYSHAALRHPLTRSIMEKIDFRHGGQEYDRRYPDGIPTKIDIEHQSLGRVSSGLIMYPAGHARSDTGRLDELLAYKFDKLASLAMDDVDVLRARFTNLQAKSAGEMRSLCDFTIRGVPVG